MDKHPTAALEEGKVRETNTYCAPTVCQACVNTPLLSPKTPEPSTLPQLCCGGLPAPRSRGQRELGLLLEPAVCAVGSGHSKTLLGTSLTSALPSPTPFSTCLPEVPAPWLQPQTGSPEPWDSPLVTSTQLLTPPPGRGLDPPTSPCCFGWEAGLASDAPELSCGEVGGCSLPGPRVKADAALSALHHFHPCTADQQQDFDAEAEEFPFSWDPGGVGVVASLPVSGILLLKGLTCQPHQAWRGVRVPCDSTQDTCLLGPVWSWVADKFVPLCPWGGGGDNGLGLWPALAECGPRCPARYGTSSWKN